MVQPNQMVTFQDLQDMIDTEGFIRLGVFTPSNLCADRLEVEGALVIQPLDSLEFNQLVERQLISHVATTLHYVSNTNTSITVIWDTFSGSPSAARLEYKLAVSSIWIANTGAPNPGNYTLGNLAQNQTYHIRVAGYYTGILGLWSNTLVASTAAFVGAEPSAPFLTLQNYLPSEKTADYTWTASYPSGLATITGYQFWYEQLKDGTQLEENTLPAGSSPLALALDIERNCHFIYNCKVRGVDSNGLVSAWSNMVPFDEGSLLFPYVTEKYLTFDLNTNSSFISSQGFKRTRAHFSSDGLHAYIHEDSGSGKLNISSIALAIPYKLSSYTGVFDNVYNLYAEGEPESVLIRSDGNIAIVGKHLRSLGRMSGTNGWTNNNLAKDSTQLNFSFLGIGDYLQLIRISPSGKILIMVTEGSKYIYQIDFTTAWTFPYNGVADYTYRLNIRDFGIGGDILTIDYINDGDTLVVTATGDTSAGNTFSLNLGLPFRLTGVSLQANIPGKAMSAGTQLPVVANTECYPAVTSRLEEPFTNQFFRTFKEYFAV